MLNQRKLSHNWTRRREQDTEVQIKTEEVIKYYQNMYRNTNNRSLTCEELSETVDGNSSSAAINKMVIPNRAGARGAFVCSACLRGKRYRHVVPLQHIDTYMCVIKINGMLGGAVLTNSQAIG